MQKVTVASCSSRIELYIALRVFHGYTIELFYETSTPGFQSSLSDNSVCVNALQDTDFRCLAANVRHVTPRLPPLTWCKKPKGLYPRVSFTLCLSPTMTPFPTGTASLQALVSNCRRIFVKSPRHGRPALSVRLLPALHRCRAAPLARTDTQALATSPGPLVAPQRRSVAHPVTPPAMLNVGLTWR